MMSLFTKNENTERPMSNEMAFSARRDSTAADFCGNNVVNCKDTADAVSFVVFGGVIRIILADVIIRLTGIIIGRKNGTAYEKNFQ